MYGLLSGVFGADLAAFLAAFWLMSVMIALLIGAVIFWVLMLIDCATKPDKKVKKYGGKIVWILIIVLLGLLGAIIYYFAVKGNTS